MPNYCRPELLAQLTSGELSFDQAVPNFSYKDESVFLNDMLLPEFFDPIGTQVVMGSTIQLTGRVTRPAGGLFINTVEVVVYSIIPWEPAEQYPYKNEVVVNCGPSNGFFYSLNAPVPPSIPNTQSHLNYQASRCKFKGFVLVRVPSVPGGNHAEVPVIFLPVVNIKPTDFAFGSVGGSENSIYPATVPFVLFRTKCGNNDNEVTYFVKSASPTVANTAGDAYIYTEVHEPLSEIAL